MEKRRTTVSKHSKQKKIAKKLIVLTVTGSLLFGGGINAFAQEKTFDTLLKEIGESIVNYLNLSIREDVNSMTSTYSVRIDKYLENNVTKIQDKLLDFADEEKTRAQKELDKYFQQKEIELEQKVTTTIEKEKEKISQQTNLLIEEEKQKLDILFEEKEKQVLEEIVSEPTESGLKEEENNNHSSTDESS